MCGPAQTLLDLIRYAKYLQTGNPEVMLNIQRFLMCNVSNLPYFDLLQLALLESEGNEVRQSAAAVVQVHVRYFLRFFEYFYVFWVSYCRLFSALTVFSSVSISSSSLNLNTRT